MARKDTKTRQAEIVEAAIGIIGEMGVRGLTTARLAESTGMSEPNLYRHFPDKQGILAAVVDEIGSSIVARAMAVAETDAPAGERLSMILRTHIRVVHDRPGIPRLVFSEEVHVSDTALGERLMATIGSYLGLIERVVAEGIDSGEFRQGLSGAETARTFLGMVQFTALRWSISGFGFSLDKEAERLWDNFYKMVRS